MVRENPGTERWGVLVLTRRSEESIVIGGNIVVTVLSVEGDKVKLGIDAPRDVQILRQELYRAIQQQEQVARKMAAGEEPPGLGGLRDILDRAAGEVNTDGDMEEQ
jgi:carbon storage regulator